MATPSAPGSKPYRDQLRIRLVGLGFSNDEIIPQLAADLLSKTSMRPREAWRQANELSLTAAAGRFNAVRGEAAATMTKSRIWDYERWPGTGGVRPTVPVLRILAQIYGTTWDQLVDLADLQQMPPADREEFQTAFGARIRATGPLRGVPWAQAEPPAGGAHNLPVPFRSEPPAGLVVPPRYPPAEPYPPVEPTPPRQPGPGLPAARTAAGQPDPFPPAGFLPGGGHGGDPPAPGDTPRDALIEVAAAESARLAMWAGATNVTDEVLAHLNNTLRAVSHAYLSAHPLPLLIRARQLRTTVGRLLQGHQRPDQSRELYLVGARACTLLAWMTGDLGNHAAADEHAFAAWMCAEMAGHDGARMWVRATQSKLAYWSGRYVESAQLAADGLRYTPADSAAVLLALLEARAWARTGRVEQSERALARWHHERERIPGPDEVGGILACSQAQEHYMAGSTRLWLRQPEQAIVESGWAVVLFERTSQDERFYGAEALTRIDSARALLATRDLDGAAEALAPVLSVDSGQRLDTFLQSLTQLRGVLAGKPFRDSATAHDLQERIEAYGATAIGREASAP